MKKAINWLKKKKDMVLSMENIALSGNINQIFSLLRLPLTPPTGDEK